MASHNITLVESFTELSPSGKSATDKDMSPCLIIKIIIIIIILIKRYSLTRVKLTALYKRLITKTTLTYISAKLNYCSFNYHYRLSNNTHTHTRAHRKTCPDQSPLVHSYNN